MGRGFPEEAETLVEARLHLEAGSVMMEAVRTGRGQSCRASGLEPNP